MPTDFLEFHEEAGSEYDAAFEWYLEPGPDAALRFDAEVNRALAQNCGGPAVLGDGIFLYPPIFTPAVSLYSDLPRAEL
jgi:hypothetical protein